MTDENGNPIVYNTIKGLVYNDSNNNGRLNNESGIGQVAVYLYDAGPDGVLDNGDDTFQGTSTLQDGTFQFSAAVPYGLTGQNYRLSVVTSSAALDGKILTSGNNPLYVYVTAGSTSSGNEFGFHECSCNHH